LCKKRQRKNIKAKTVQFAHTEEGKKAARTGAGRARKNRLSAKINFCLFYSVKNNFTLYTKAAEKRHFSR
jgi:hypothetical protein